MIDNELKKKFAAFIKANLPSDSMSEEDIAWIMDECDKGNKPTYDDFVKARRQPKNIESGDIRCKNCKNSSLHIWEDPCKNCLKLDMDQPSGLRHTCFEKKDIVDARDSSMDFGPNMMRQEEFKIPDSIKMIIDQNKKPNLVIPQLDGIEKKIKDFAKAEKAAYDALTSNLNCIQSTENTIKSHQINLEKANHAIEEKIDKLTETLESVNSKLDILDQRMHDFRRHQILKDMKCVTQVKDISERPEPKFKVDDEVQVVADVFRIKYTIERIYWSNGPASSRGWWYVLESSSDKTRRHVQEDLLILFKQEEKDISDAKELPKFNVGDKVKLKHGKTVYDVYSITYFMHDKKKVYRYKIGHSASTTHYESENRLIKA